MSTENALIGSFLQEVSEPFQGLLAPTRLAGTLHMSLEDLARLTGLHRNTLSGSPGSPKVQAKLGEIATILARAEALTGEQGRAILWFRHQPLAGFSGQTAEQLVAEGQAEAVMRHLDLIEDGVAA